MNEHFQWRVVKISEQELENLLNQLDKEWEIYSVTPTIHFGAKVMGVPVPSEILYTVIARKQQDAHDL